MFLLYVDESGDTGMLAGSSPFFGLSGLVVHELAWHQTIEAILDFRRQLRDQYGLKLKEEIHAKPFIHKPGDLARIPKDIRLRILRDVLDFLEGLPDINLIHILVKKSGHATTYDVFDKAWMVMLQRFHNTMSHRNFPGPRNSQDFGLVVADNTDEKKLRTLVRKLRRYNPIPNKQAAGFRHMPMRLTVEDPVHRDSLHSYFVQLVDVSAYFLVQREKPCGYVKRKGARNWFDRMDAVLCKVASTSDPKGVVRL
jgi:hypothetical protein